MSDTITFTELELSDSEEYVGHEDRLIRVKTLEYPLSLSMIQSETPVAFGTTVPLSLLQSMGYELVRESVVPVNDVVIEISPAQREDGNWYRAYSDSEFSSSDKEYRLSEAKRAALSDLTQVYENTIYKGIPYDFHFGEETRTLHVQMRPTDQLNLLILADEARNSLNFSARFSASFCTYENVVVPVIDSYDVREIRERVRIASSKAKQLKWSIRDQVNTAQDLDLIPSPIEVRARFSVITA